MLDAEPPNLVCPVCRAGDNRTAQCRRCKADLSLLQGLERDRAAHLRAAALHAGRGQAEACCREARLAHELRPDSQSRLWLAVGLLLTRNYQEALAHHRQLADKSWLAH
jgi:hypothetical protein